MEGASYGEANGGEKKVGIRSQRGVKRGNRYKINKDTERNVVAGRLFLALLSAAYLHIPCLPIEAADIYFIIFCTTGHSLRPPGASRD